jgi:hypothetical protein
MLLCENIYQRDTSLFFVSIGQIVCAVRDVLQKGCQVSIDYIFGPSEVRAPAEQTWEGFNKKTRPWSGIGSCN